MLRLAVTVIIVLAMGLPAPAQTAAAAMPCSLLTKGDAVVQANGVAVPLPASLADCRALRVQRGEVVACLDDGHGEPVCRSFAQGEMIDASRFGTAAGHAPPAALERLLRGSPGAAPGQWRGADPLLPNKTVLLLDGRLLVDFSEPDMQGVESVEIRGDSIDGPVLAVAARTSGPTPIDAGTLSVGRHYWAVLVPSSRPTQTPKRFTIAAPQEQQAVRERLRAFERQNAGPLATAMMRAAWLAQQDYDYDALVTMKSVGMRAR